MTLLALCDHRARVKCCLMSFGCSDFGFHGTFKTIMLCFGWRSCWFTVGRFVTSAAAAEPDRRRLWLKKKKKVCSSSVGLCVLLLKIPGYATLTWTLPLAPRRRTRRPTETQQLKAGGKEEEEKHKSSTKHFNMKHYGRWTPWWSYLRQTWRDVNVEMNFSN